MANIPFSAAADMNTIKVNELGQLYTDSQVNLFANPWDLYGSISKQWDISAAQDGSYLVTLYESGLLLFAGLGLSDMPSTLPWADVADRVRFMHMLDPLRLSDQDLIKPFADLANLERIGDLKFEMTGSDDQYTGLNQPFYGLEKLESVGDIYFCGRTQNDTGQNCNIEFENVFEKCSALKSVGNITVDMSCDKGQEESGWGAYLESMFYGCTSLETTGNFDIDVQSGGEAYLDSMFYGCSSLETTGNFDIDIQSSGEAYLSEMFYGCTSLATTGNFDIDVQSGRGVYLNEMFYGCTSLEILGRFNVHFYNKDLKMPGIKSADPNLSNMFAGCPVSDLSQGFNLFLDGAYADGAFDEIDGDTYLSRYDMAVMTDADKAVWESFGRNIVSV